jgi:hypothetical protein
LERCEWLKPLLVVRTYCYKSTIGTVWFKSCEHEGLLWYNFGWEQLFSMRFIFLLLTEIDPFDVFLQNRKCEKQRGARV